MFRTSGVGQEKLWNWTCFIFQRNSDSRSKVAEWYPIPIFVSITIITQPVRVDLLKKKKYSFFYVYSLQLDGVNKCVIKVEFFLGCYTTIDDAFRLVK